MLFLLPQSFHILIKHVCYVINFCFVEIPGGLLQLEMRVCPAVYASSQGPLFKKRHSRLLPNVNEFKWISWNSIPLLAIYFTSKAIYYPWSVLLYTLSIYSNLPYKYHVYTDRSPRQSWRSFAKRYSSKENSVGALILPAHLSPVFNCNVPRFNTGNSVISGLSHFSVVKLSSKIMWSQSLCI